MTARYIEATGATDGSIIAAIMTTHSGRNSPNTSHGPAIDPGIPGFCRISSRQGRQAGRTTPNEHQVRGRFCVCGVG